MAKLLIHPLSFLLLAQRKETKEKGATKTN